MSFHEMKTSLLLAVYQLTVLCDAVEYIYMHYRKQTIIIKIDYNYYQFVNDFPLLNLKTNKTKIPIV